jgi:hypothetical protein
LQSLVKERHVRKSFVGRDSVLTAETVVMAGILIVEDDGFLRDDAEMMIPDWGYDILSAGDLNEALSLLRSPRP